MTICIAVLCEGGQSVIVAADRMVSAPFLTVEFDHPNVKIEEISPRCVALSAGDVLAITEMFSENSGISQQLQAPTVNLISEEIKQRFVHLRHKQVDESLFIPRGMSFGNFYDRSVISGVPSDLAMMLDNRVSSFRLGVEIIVSGVDGSGGHIYQIVDPGTSQCFDRLGYHAIGSGQRHAILSLVALQHNINVDLDQALFNIYLAKRQAEIAPGVGTGTDIMIIKDELKPVDAETMKELKDRLEGLSVLPTGLVISKNRTNRSRTE